MIYLLLIILLFGLFQSLLELKKEESSKSKWDIKRILSLLYIGGFVFGLLVILLQEKESYKLKENIKNISSSVFKIDSITAKQFNEITKSFKQTQVLIKKSDSLNLSMTHVIEVNKNLISQYKDVNKKLLNQLNIERQQLMERSPNIDMSDNDVSLDGNDSTSYCIKACIRNLGKRNALINAGCGYVLFINNKNQPIQYVEIRGNSNKTLLEPSELRNMTYCYYSFALTDFKKLKIESDFAVICLKINYKDIAIDKDSVAYYYCGWNPSVTIFGGLKDWQFGIAKKWARENLKFNDK